MNCHACRYSYMEPSGEAVLICGHRDAGFFGTYLRKQPADHCPSFIKFDQHPLRNPDGSLKSQGVSQR